jgi:hypothetical protein
LLPDTDELDTNYLGGELDELERFVVKKIRFGYGQWLITFSQGF